MTDSQPQEQSSELPALMVDSIDDVIPLAKIIELRNKKLSYSEIGKILGCSKQNIDKRLQPFKTSIDNLQAIKDHRADNLAVVSSVILNKLTTDDIKKASLQQKVTAYGILYDKERIERGQVSNIIGHVDFTAKLSDLDQQEALLMAELGIDHTGVSEDEDD